MSLYPMKYRCFRQIATGAEANTAYNITKYNNLIIPWTQYFWSYCVSTVNPRPNKDFSGIPRTQIQIISLEYPSEPHLTEEVCVVSRSFRINCNYYSSNNTKFILKSSCTLLGLVRHKEDRDVSNSFYSNRTIRQWGNGSHCSD